MGVGLGLGMGVGIGFGSGWDCGKDERGMGFGGNLCWSCCWVQS